ncbi:MAG: type II toxin-antitoxin system HicB family antitoxin [Nostoc sp.]
MAIRFILSDYVDRAMSNDKPLCVYAQAVYDKLEDGTFAGRIPLCKGVIAFASTLRECEDELHSTLEDWILLGLKLGHSLPVIDNIDLNKEPTLEPMDTL